MALKRFLFSLMNQGSPKNTFLRTGLRFGISPTFPSFHVALQNSAIFVGMIASKNGQIWSPPLCFYSISGCWMVKQRIGPPPLYPLFGTPPKKVFFSGLTLSRMRHVFFWSGVSDPQRAFIVPQTSSLHSLQWEEFCSFSQKSLTICKGTWCSIIWKCRLLVYTSLTLVAPHKDTMHDSLFTTDW